MSESIEIDDENRELIHELILSNRVVEDMMKNVNEIHGVEAAEKVVQDFLQRDEDGEELYEEDNLDARSVTTEEQEQTSSFDAETQGRSQIYRLVERTPRLLDKLMKDFCGSSHDGRESESIPKNRRDETNLAKNNNEEILQQAIEQVDHVYKSLEQVYQVFSDNS